MFFAARDFPVHYFTFTRRKSEDGEPSGVTTAFDLPSAVRSRFNPHFAQNMVNIL